ncbi:stage 0 sporulation protein B (sporulation initiation phosphotransferase) [Gracilibacillus ureilyticus]|uniref:Stage 0 sporulation protein B (Sporulation initiation phosphotransferase) n=1 Tax=Gracilibacillus ureilyticus TaxID=531814 RepID=A0A1H9RP69_9BACI|nr:Spo0B domain-containing protein [Gracilibacillus ureilyticus]SER74477.1 stage 0 sporulation protein B (sporulation initiation phosphotransferase) [Gracilibacillus ureilyticus]
MDEKEVIELLRHYRHDHLNDLQLVMGYLQLGKQDKAEAKINDIIEKANNERQLDRLQIPKTMLWIYTKNWFSENMSLEYRMDIDDQSAMLSDELLKQQLERIFAELSAYQKEFQHYQTMLVFHTDQQMELTVEGEWTDLEALINQLKSHNFLDAVQVKEDKQLQIIWTEYME